VALGIQSPSAKEVLVVAVPTDVVVQNPSDQGEFGSASQRAGNLFVEEEEEEEEAVLVVMGIQIPSFVEEEVVLVALGIQSPSAKEVLVCAVQDAVAVQNPSDQGDFGSALLKFGNPFVEEGAASMGVGSGNPSGRRA